jgi:hypothetical protein
MNRCPVFPDCAKKKRTVLVELIRTLNGAGVV